MAGALPVLVFHPIELVKFRWQVYDKDTKIRPDYKNYRQAFLSIYRQSGITGLYAGVTPNVFGSAVAWGGYFFIYDKLKSYNSSQTFLNAVGAGCIVQALTNPIWVVKTQCCLQYERAHRPVSSVIKEIARKRGAAGFYRGFVPGLANTLHGGIQMSVYELLKRLNPLGSGRAADALNGGVSKAITMIILYPITTVKVRLQEQHRENSRMLETIRDIYRQHGIPGFYRGLPLQLMRQPFAAGLTFLIWEEWKRKYS